MNASDVTLFGHWICPFSVRVEFALAHRQIDYSMIDVPPRAVRPKGFVVPQEFIEHSPKLEVPMIKINMSYLADSIPILLWLEESFGDHSLLPGGQGSVDLVNERMAWLDTHLYRPMIGVYYGVDPSKIEESSKAFGNALTHISQWLNDSLWMAGDEVTLVEAIMAGVYTRITGLQQLGLTADIPDEISEHMHRMTSLAAWETIHWSDQQTDEFVARFKKYRERQSQ